MNKYSMAKWEQEAQQLDLSLKAYRVLRKINDKPINLSDLLAKKPFPYATSCEVVELLWFELEPRKLVEITRTDTCTVYRRI